jgi:G3E family GTPase
MEFVNARLGTASDDEEDEVEAEDDNEEVEGNTDGAAKAAQRVARDVADAVKKEDLTKPMVIRSKGFFWLASRPSDMMLWSQAGGLFQLSPGGAWWADTPRDMWPEDEESVKSDWMETVGDRR